MEKTKTRVVVGMSGGVDSSAAAALLLEQGYDVVGITLKLWPQDCSSRAEDKCCGPQAVSDARSVCDKLGIPFYLADDSDLFKREVIENFVQEYKAGRTPNPCVLCNEKLKFGALLRRARQMGAEFVATGHYARVGRSPDGSRTLLKRGLDPNKDQSYFLFSLKQDQLERILMPLGELSKTDTRNVARQTGLKTADKEESMEICFVPDQDYGSFLTSSGAVQVRQGDIVNESGKVLGHHRGIEFYTVGQRKGLGISSPTPLYVLELDPVNNRVIVGGESGLEKSEYQVERCNWISEAEPSGPMEVVAKIRYKHPGVAATVTPIGNGRAAVRLHVPQRAVTPGQASVFYQGDVVAGGGWICR